MEEQKECAPVERSVKYMAWNIKQMDEHLKGIAISLKELVEIMRKPNQIKITGPGDETPF